MASLSCLALSTGYTQAGRGIIGVFEPQRPFPVKHTKHALSQELNQVAALPLKRFFWLLSGHLLEQGIQLPSSLYLCVRKSMRCEGGRVRCSVWLGEPQRGRTPRSVHAVFCALDTVAD